MNVVDALVVTLNLDSSQFRKDQVAVSDSSKKLKENLVKHGKDVEKSGKDAAESWGALRNEILGVVAAYLGLEAVKDAIKDVTKSNKDLANSAQAIGMSTKDLDAWGKAVERMGGDATTARASLQHLADIFNDLKSGHASTATLEWFGRLQAEGGVKLNAMKPMLEQLPQIAEGLKHIAQVQGAARALYVGKQLGLDEGTIRLLMQGKTAVEGITKETGKLAPTSDQIAKTNQLYRAWVELKQMFESLANVLTANFAPAIQVAIEKFTEWFGILKDNQKTPRLTFGEAKKQFNGMIDAIREGTAPAIKFFQDVFGPPIKWVIEQIKKLKHEINDVYRTMFGHDLFSESFNDVFDKYRHGGGSGERGAARAGIGARVRHGHRGGGEGAGPSSGPAAPRDPHATSIAMKAAMDQLHKEGVPEANLKAAAAHLVGQAEMESGLRPGLTHDSGTGYGIYGARLGRRDRMLAWLAANGYAKDSLEGQTRYMAHEAMSGRYKNTRNILMNAQEGSLGQDSRTITHEFESPRVDNDRSGAVRGAYRRGPRPSMPATLGAPGAAGARNSTTNSQTTNSTSTEAVFNGGIAIHTQATDAPGLMRELQAHIDRNNFTAQANYGIA